jgi:hypothetical protein
MKTREEKEEGRKRKKKEKDEGRVGWPPPSWGLSNGSWPVLLK